MLAALDILEGVERGVYYRATVAVVLDGSDEQTSVSAYLFPPFDGLADAAPFLAVYGPEQHAQYRPRPLEPQIKELLQLE